MSMGEHGSGMVEDFAGIRVTQQDSARELMDLKHMLKLKEEKLAFVHSNLAKLRQEGMEKVKRIGIIGDLVGEIPEYKKRISELSESVDQTQRATQDKLEEISRVQQKQDRDNAMVEERIERERLKERVREKTNIDELEKIFKGTQEIQVENAQRQLERERRKVEQQIRVVEKENKMMREKHNKKVQLMNNQLLEANKSPDQSKVMSMEDVRKDMELKKQEYESQLGDLTKKIAALKERKAGQAAVKKKNVSFALPDDDSSYSSDFNLLGENATKSHSSPFKSQARLPVKARTATTAPQRSLFKFVTRPAETSSLGLTSDFCTFTPRRMVCTIF